MLVTLLNVSNQGFSMVLCRSFRPLSVQLDGSPSPPCYRLKFLTLFTRQFVSSFIRRTARAMLWLYDLIGDTTRPKKMLSLWILGLNVTKTTVLSSEHWVAISQHSNCKIQHVQKPWTWILEHLFIDIYTHSRHYVTPLLNYINWFG